LSLSLSLLLDSKSKYDHEP